MYNEIEETKVVSLELKVNFSPLTTARYRKTVWERLKEAYLNEEPLNQVEGYGDDFYVDDIKLKP